MRIGVDIQIARWTGAGLYSYIANLFDWLGRIEHPHHLAAFLYGEPWMQEPETILRLRQEVPGLELQYCWDGVPPRLLCDLFHTDFNHAPWLVRQIDSRALYPLWKRLVAEESLPLTRWLYERMGPAAEVDLFHHMGVVIFPLRASVNVMTIPDLSPLRVAECHVDDAIQHWKESFDFARHMDAVLTYSEHTKREVVEHLGVPEDRIRVTPLAAHSQYRPLEDRARVQDVLARHGLLDRPYVLHVGTLEPRKNLGRLVEAFHQVRQQDPALPHRLVLVGGKGWMYESIFETVSRLDLGPHVKWLDYAPFEDLPALINGADLLAYPSLYEGFGLPPLEAMSCGTPVVTSNASSLPEVVGDAGLLVDPFAVEELAEALRRVLTNKGLRATLSQKGLAQARTFTWERTARLTLAAYEAAAARAVTNGHPKAKRPAGRTKLRETLRKGVVHTIQAHVDLSAFPWRKG